MVKKFLVLACVGASMNAHDIKPGQIYRHYKGKLYKVVAIAVDTESKWIDDPVQITSAEKRVIYHGFGDGHALSTEIFWDRPYEMFAGTCEVDGKEQKRFALCTLPERVTARIALINKENKLFLLKHVTEKGIWWFLPGGKIDECETPFEAAQRELLEETGIKDAEFMGNSFYREHITPMISNGALTHFKEHIFIARTAHNHAAIFDNLQDYEKEMITEGRWWSKEELHSSGELYLRDLCKYLE